MHKRWYQRARRRDQRLAQITMMIALYRFFHVYGVNMALYVGKQRILSGPEFQFGRVFTRSFQPLDFRFFT